MEVIIVILAVLFLSYIIKKIHHTKRIEKILQHMDKAPSWYLEHMFMDQNHKKSSLIFKSEEDINYIVKEEISKYLYEHHYKVGMINKSATLRSLFTKVKETFKKKLLQME